LSTSVSSRSDGILFGTVLGPDAAVDRSVASVMPVDSSCTQNDGRVSVDGIKQTSSCVGWTHIRRCHTAVPCQFAAGMGSMSITHRRQQEEVHTRIPKDVHLSVHSAAYAHAQDICGVTSTTMVPSCSSLEMLSGCKYLQGATVHRHDGFQAKEYKACSTRASVCLICARHGWIEKFFLFGIARKKRKWHTPTETARLILEDQWARRLRI
jgi:hypothetical protein